jgi:F-type H+-transporting ATPase subunit b
VIPDLSVAWVIVFVLVLTGLLDRLLLRPLTRIMADRRSAIESARALTEASRARAQASSDEFDAKTRTARAELYQQMEEARRAAMARRAQVVAETRREVEQLVTDATARIRRQAAEAASRIDQDADAFASTIVEQVLGRKAS